MRSLTWNMVYGNQIEIAQENPKDPVYLPLSDTARTYMGKPGMDDNPVFILLSNSHLSVILKTWSSPVGMKKKVTFHVARHTFATLALSSGADIYTVSKLLVHSRLETIQVYTKIIDYNKVETVNMLPDIGIG